MEKLLMHIGKDTRSAHSIITYNHCHSLSQLEKASLRTGFLSQLFLIFSTGLLIFLISIVYLYSIFESLHELDTRIHLPPHITPYYCGIRGTLGSTKQI